MQNLMPVTHGDGIYSCVAPMDGITDAAYRRVVYELFGRYGRAGDVTMMYTEFMSAA